MSATDPALAVDDPLSPKNATHIPLELFPSLLVLRFEPLALLLPPPRRLLPIFPFLARLGAHFAHLRLPWQLPKPGEIGEHDGDADQQDDDLGGLPRRRRLRTVAHRHDFCVRRGASCNGFRSVRTARCRHTWYACSRRLAGGPFAKCKPARLDRFAQLPRFDRYEFVVQSHLDQRPLG